MSAPNNLSKESIAVSEEGEQFALVVGVNNSIKSSYLKPLLYAERDARTMVDVLRQTECNFTVLEPPLIGKEAHTMAIKQAVTELITKGTRQDFLLFYFSGHAKRMKTGENQEDVYLVTHDFEETKVKVMPDLYLSMSWLWKAFYQHAEAGRALLILDCCYAGKMIGAGNDPYQVDIRKIVEDYLNNSSIKGHPDRLRLILMATRDDTTAWEQHGHGFMTSLFLQALRGEVRELLDDDGRVDITSLAEYLKKEMQVQPPDLWMEGSKKPCILACHPQLSPRSLRHAHKAREDILMSAIVDLKDQITDPTFFKRLANANTHVHIQNFDLARCDTASVVDLNQEKVTDFFKRDRVQIQDDFYKGASDRDQLQYFGLLQESSSTYGTLLCFGLSPTKWLPGAFTRCTIWRGNDRHNGWLDAQDYRRDLVSQFESGRDFLRKYLPLIRRIGRDERTEELEIPLVALGEALANALIHREYVNQTTPIYIDIFDDRIEISSPGVPPEPMTLELLAEEHTSHPRNPQIARIFYLYGYVEKVGSGIHRLQHALQKAGLPSAKFELGKDKTFKVIFYRSKQSEEEVRSLVAGEVSVPFMTEDLPAGFIPRPQEYEALLTQLLDEQRAKTVAITTAIRGAGGYGKTTLAKALCHDPLVKHAFQDGILWVTLGENPRNLVEKVNDLIYMLSAVRPGFTSLEAASSRLATLLADREILLVIDDVWRAIDLRPFLQGGPRCARLITTRNDGVLPSDVSRVLVDSMSQEQAVQLLYAGIGTPDDLKKYDQVFYRLAQRLKEWPLLLSLANGILHNRINRHSQTIPDALIYLNHALDKRGLTAFDPSRPQERHEGIARTLEVSFALLDEEEYARYQELAIFPEEIDIPLVTLQKLWNATGRLDDFDTEALCERLYTLSLLLRLDRQSGSVRLHDVIRAYLLQKIGENLIALNGKLLDTYGLTRWAKLASNEPYLWKYLAYHLASAGRVGELIATVKDLSYLATKIAIRGTYATEYDLEMAEQQAPKDASLRLLKRHIANMSHLLKHMETWQDIAVTIQSRLYYVNELADLCHALGQELPRPFLIPLKNLPDLPHPAQIRTLQDHMHRVSGCAVSPDGTWLVSASADNTLKIWDTTTGEVRHTLTGHTARVSGCAISPDGTWLVSASDDGTLKIWDARTAQERLSLQGHTGAVSGCAISPDGTWLVSASADNTLKIWDARTAQERLSLQGHTGAVSGCAISPDGTWLVSASDDGTLKIWDATTKEVHHTLTGHTARVSGCAISPDGAWLVSASDDGTLKIWDAHAAQERSSLQGHTGAVNGCAISPDGEWVVSASEDHTLKIWDAATGVERLTLTGHTHRVCSCGVSPDGLWIVSASDDYTLKIWDAATGAERLTLTGHTASVKGCAVSPDGTWLVSASDDYTLKIWDIATGAERLTLTGHTARVSGCAISPDGTWLVSASDDGTLKIWDAHKGVYVVGLSVDGKLFNCVFYPDDERLIAGGTRGLYFLRLVL